FYVSSGMVAGGSFFESSFGMDYRLGMTLVAGIVVLYTLVGGFLAVSWTDVVQGLMMVGALILVPTVAIIHVGGFSPMVQAIKRVDPTILHPSGGTLSATAAIGIISALAWGLGYFG
ncbi:UNVERIFIED_CONTAM: sodium:proline symporter, partial [Bacillus sp. ATCC 13368]